MRTWCGAGTGCVALLTPPFDRSAQEPGYIKGYPPGVRENGGQYTHAAVWTVMAMARLGYGDEAVELFHMLNPVNHTRTAADVERYKAEPYVLAGDVFAHPAHAGRAGWTWYTGSAGWMYRAGLESILGLRRRGATFEVDPCIPRRGPATPSRGASARPATRSTSSTRSAARAGSPRRCSTARPSTRPRSRCRTTAGGTS